MNTMEHYSAIKRRATDILNDLDESQNNYTELKKSDPSNNKILYIFMYTKFQGKKTNLQYQKSNKWFPEDVERD